MKRRITAIAACAVLLLCGVVWARMTTVVVGQSSGFSCTGYSLYSSLNSADLVTTPTCGTGGTYTTGADAVSWPGSGTQKANTTASGLTFPSSDFPTTGFILEFDIVMVEGATASPWTSGWVTLWDNYDGDGLQAITLHVNTWGGTTPNWAMQLYADGFVLRNPSTTNSATYLWSANDVLHFTITVAPSAGSLTMNVTKNGSAWINETATGSAYTITNWHDANFNFFRHGTHTSIIKNVSIHQ